MVNYRSAADLLEDDHLPHMALLRTPTSGTLAGVVTCHMLVQLRTHHTRRRTVGCADPCCPDCDAMVPIRYEGYVSLYSPTTRKHAIVGLTLGAVRQIREQLGRLDRTRGLSLVLGRFGKKPNGRVMVECKHLEANPISFPDPPDIIAHLERIWGPERRRELEAYAAKIQNLSPFDRAQRDRSKRLAPDERYTIVDLPPDDHLDGQTTFFGS